MPKQALDTLTESMFYVLMALGRGELCGTEITTFVEGLTGGALRIGPATLYTILAKFEKEGLIAQTGTMGCKRYYIITGAGCRAYQRELERLQRCVADAGRAAAFRFAQADLPQGGTNNERKDHLALDPLPGL